jgi:iron(III) transport system substrate-binding protein
MSSLVQCLLPARLLPGACCQRIHARYVVKNDTGTGMERPPMTRLVEWLKQRLLGLTAHAAYGAVLAGAGLCLGAAYVWLAARPVVILVVLLLVLSFVVFALALYVLWKSGRSPGESEAHHIGAAHALIGLCALLAVAFAGFTVVRLLRSGPEVGSVVVYSAMSPDLSKELQIAFTRQTGLEAQMQTWEGGALQLEERIESEGPAVGADVFLGGTLEIHERLARAGLLEAYISPLDRKTSFPEFRSSMSKGCWWNLLVFAYNPGRLPGDIAPANLDWDNLFDSRLHGEVAVPDPSKTGAGFVFLATQIFRLHRDTSQVRSFLQRLKQNKVKYESPATSVVHDVGTGSAVLGVAWRSDVVRLQRQAHYDQLKFAVPTETSYEVGTVSILKYARHKESAKRFVDFMLDGRAAQILADDHRVPFYNGPIVVPPDLSDTDLSPLRLKFINYDRRLAAAHLSEWIRLWERIAVGR